jgi:hypothetical protein
MPHIWLQAESNMQQTPQRKRKWDMPGDPPAGATPGLAPHLIQEAQAAAIAAAQRLTAVRTLIITKSRHCCCEYALSGLNAGIR